MMYVVLWFMFAIASASIAGAKGYSSGLWFCIGLIFGPFGLIVGFYPAIKKGANTRPCPLCAEPILPAAIKCKHCGGDVLPVAVALAPGHIHRTPEEAAKYHREAQNGALIIIAMLVAVGIAAKYFGIF